MASRIQHQNPTEPPSAAARDEVEAAAFHACAMHRLLVSKLPAGQKMLGEEGSRRATLIRKRLVAPTAADWERLARAGQREGVAAYFLAEADRLKAVPVPDADVTLAHFSRESGEAFAVGVEARRDPSLRVRAISEQLDVLSIGGQYVRREMRLMHEETEESMIAKRRLADFTRHDTRPAA